MKIKSLFKQGFSYLKDQSVDIRIRLLFFMEYASLIACLIGTGCMILLKQSVMSMVPNFVLFITSFLALYFSHVKKKYNLSSFIEILGCANIAVPWMFFSAGGNDSGMHIWFIFSIVVTCLMSDGKIRIFMSTATILQHIACICMGHFYPETISPLVGENAEFFDQLQSFAVACAFLAVMLIIYITTYENQRRKLEIQSIELRNIMQTDALTGLFNRHAYYNEINAYKNSRDTDDLVLVAMDLNGLKKINDLSGHSAGDEYICAAAKVITRALGQYGHIFRTGGDEFMAILHCSEDETHNFENRINECIADSDISWTEQMSVAVGIVCCSENPNADFSELEKLADARMYENKTLYYRKNNIERRK